MKILFSQNTIAETVRRMGQQISLHYRTGDDDLHSDPDQPLLVIGVLNGAFIFMADLVRELDIPNEVDFVRVASYGDARHTSHRIDLAFSGSISPVGRHVLLIEDVVDSGTTFQWLREYYRQQSVKSVLLATMIDKPGRREIDITPDFIGLTAPNQFLVGYGMDDARKRRGLKDICICD